MYITPVQFFSSLFRWMGKGGRRMQEDTYTFVGMFPSDLLVHVQAHVDMLYTGLGNCVYQKAEPASCWWQYNVFSSVPFSSSTDHFFHLVLVVGQVSILPALISQEGKEARESQKGLCKSGSKTFSSSTNLTKPKRSTIGWQTDNMGWVSS